VSLVLNGVDYGPVQSASGAQGWFGEGYWFHDYVPGLSWKGCCFVAKTTTLERREGNMPFWDTEIIKQRKHHFRPMERFPKCVVVKPWKGVVLNSVGLSGPGAEALFNTREWQRRQVPFFLSFMSVAPTPEERFTEAQRFWELLVAKLPEFAAPFGLQINLSCPNTEHDPAEIAGEARKILGIFQSIRSRVPIVPKFNVLFPVEAMDRLRSLCDAVCVSNTIPYGQLPAAIDWGAYFGREWAPINKDSSVGGFVNSPLAHLGGGGLSGKPLLPLVASWVQDVRTRRIDVPIIAGGGILSPYDVDVLADAGADSVFLGSIAMLRGWRLQKTIRRAHKLLGA